MKIDTIKSGGQSQGGLDNAGGTLSGPLKLSRDPQVPMEAATKRYVDTTLSNLSASNVVSGTLPIARLPAFSGDVTSEAGGNNVVLSNTDITVGEYGKIVVDAKGRATNGTGLGNSDIPNFNFSKITTDKPTTLAGYGITDGISLAGGAMTGPLVLSGSPVSGDNLVPKQYIDGMVNSLSASKTGDVIRKAYATTPAGFLKCNGAEVSKTTYADLYAVIGESNNSYNVIGSGQPWRQQYEINKLQSQDIGPWSTGTSLPGILSESSVIVTKNRVYLLGGNNGVACVSTVYTAAINADGTLGAWGTGTSLPGPVAGSQAVVTKNRVYLLGGYIAGSGAIATVYTASINSDGTLGIWTATTSLPAVLVLAQTVVTNKYVYLIGGSTGGSSLSSVWSSPINSDGTLGVWSTTNPSLPSNVSYPQLATTKNRVYLLGGSNGSTATSTVYTASINADGTLGTWSLSTSLPSNLTGGQIFVTKNRVYLLGGSNGSTPTSTVYTAAINADGTLGTWTTGTTLPGALSISQVFATNSRIYLCSGYNGSSHISTVYISLLSGGLNDYSAYYSEDTTNYMMPGSGKPWQQQYQINTTQSGDITGWTSGTPLPISLTYSQVIVTKNRVYMIGGYDGSQSLSQVYFSTINSDGTLGTWTTGTSLPVQIAGHRVIINKNRVYLFGGFNSGPGLTNVNRYNTIYTAPINADGTLGTWVLNSSVLPVVSEAHYIFLTKNRVYLIGGYNGTTYISSAYTAPINSDGTLGTWTTGPSIPTAQHWGSVAVVKNRVYLIGGQNSAALNNVFSATINSDGFIGPWNVEQSLPIAISAANVYVTNNTIYIIGGNGVSGSLNTVYRANIQIDGSLTTWVSGTTLPNIIHASETFIVKNKIYVISGKNTGISNIVYTATIAEGLNDYSPYYDGTIQPVEPVNPTTTFKLPDMSATDVNGIYHYIKF